MPELNLEWRQWVQENVVRGVPDTELVRILLEHHFDPESSRQVVWEYVTQHRNDGGAFQSSLSADPGTEIENTYESRLPCLESGHPWSVIMEITDPVIVMYGNVLNDEECERLIEGARSRLERSTTVDSETGERVEHEYRTSQGMFFQLCENELLTEIDHRLALLMNQPIEHSEGMQVLNYRVGGEYKPHYDFFPSDQKGSRVHIGNWGQRVATAILYLNEPEEGGETIFPELNIKVRPVKGNVLYFSYFHRGEVDLRTLHGGAPVIKGEKWIATRWVREKPYT